MLRALAFVGLLTLAALPFRGALDVGFLQDDFNVAHVLGPDLRIDGSTVFRLVHPPADEKDCRLRPVSYLTLLVDLEVFGLDPFALHLTGLLFHLVATALVFALARILWPAAPSFPWIAALLFGLSPVHADSVGWLAARSDPVVGALSLATLLAYARYRLNGSNTAAVCCLVLYAGALLSKEAAVVTPGLIVLMEPVLRTHPRARRGGFWPALTGLAILTGIYLLYRHHLFGVFLGRYGDQDAASLSAVRAETIRHGLGVLVADVPAGWLRWTLVVAPASLVLLFLVFARRPLPWRSVTGRTALFVLGIGVAILPVIPFLGQAAGRHFYLAAAPLAGLVAAAASHPRLRRGVPGAARIAGVLVLGLAAALGVRTRLDDYIEAGRITRAVRRDLFALRRDHPDLRTIVVGDLKTSWKRAPLFFSGFPGIAAPPFQPEPVPVVPRFAGEARDARWEAYMMKKPLVLVRLRTPPERPGLEPVSPLLRGDPPRQPVPEDYSLVAPTGDAVVRPGQDVVFRFRVPADRDARAPLRLLVEFPGRRLAALLLGPNDVVHESNGPDDAPVLVWRPRQGVGGNALRVQESLASPLPIVWWIEEADLHHPGVRPVKSSRKARFRFVP
jgi:hypothetical protein